MTQKAYLVTEGSYSDYSVVRVYLDRDEAQRFVDYYNANDPDHGYDLEIEERNVGCSAEYDGPGWRAWWEGQPDEARRGVPMHGWHHEGGWWFNHRVRPTWLTGSGAKARITYCETHGNYVTRINVEGTSKEHVEKAMFDAAARVKVAAWDELAQLSADA